MEEKITLDMLTQDSVVIRKQNVAVIDNKEYILGDNWTGTYMNNTMGRKDIQASLEEKYVTAIFSVWGDIPTIVEE